MMKNVSLLPLFPIYIRFLFCLNEHKILTLDVLQLNEGKCFVKHFRTAEFLHSFQIAWHEKLNQYHKKLVRANHDQSGYKT